MGLILIAQTILHVTNLCYARMTFLKARDGPYGLEESTLNHFGGLVYDLKTG